jgi:hypothetical protein
MKKTTTKRLRLNLETLKYLDGAELARAGGGAPWATNFRKPTEDIDRETNCKTQ